MYSQGGLWPLQTLSILASDVFILWHASCLHAIHVPNNQELEFGIAHQSRRSGDGSWLSVDLWTVGQRFEPSVYCQVV